MQQKIGSLGAAQVLSTCFVFSSKLSVGASVLAGCSSTSKLGHHGPSFCRCGTTKFLCCL